VLKISAEDGHVIDPKQVPVEANTAIRFEAVSDSSDWKVFKVGLGARRSDIVVVCRPVVPS
jgi:hypothetical protein